MKDMGEASYILGVKIYIDRSNKLVALSQEHYIKKIFEWFNMQDCNPIDTPFARGENLSKEMSQKTPEEKKKMSNVSYSNVVWSLMYATMCTRLDIYYVVKMVSLYLENPRIMHWKAIKSILRNLKGTKDYSLCYQGKKLCLVGYS